MNTLKIRRLGIDTLKKENVAYLRVDSEFCKSQGFHAQSKVEIHFGERSILATLNLTENGQVNSGEIGLSNAAFRHLAVPEGSAVRLSHPNPLISTDLIRRKLEGAALGKADFFAIIRDIIAFRYSNIELTAFVIACFKALDEREILYLTEAMIETGERIDWNLPLVVDKHCIGGVPGNRTSMIVVPIVAAFGLPMPKTSSRAITSPSGTADAMETVANVRMTLEEMMKLVGEEGGCIAWGGSLYLAPADDILISVEQPLNLDVEGQMVASILSKKRAAGSNRLVLDIPIGEFAKVRSEEQGMRLKRIFETIGAKIGLVVKVCFTDGSQPVGRGIGPWLEVQEVMKVLKCDADAPVDLREKSIQLAGEILEFSDSVSPGSGAGIAAQILVSGKAWEKFNRIADLQGRREPVPEAKWRAVQSSPVAGKVAAIHNRKIAKVAKLAGAPQDAAAGVYLHAKLGDPVTAGAPLFTIHAQSEELLNFSLQYSQENPDVVRVLPE